MADTLSLAGRAALITGSGKANGIGGATARAFARNGAAVAIHHVSESSKERAHKLAADLALEYGVKTTVVRGAVEQPDEARRTVEDALKGLDVERIDILSKHYILVEGTFLSKSAADFSATHTVNNAGTYDPDDSSLLTATPEQLARTFAVNTYGPIYMTQAVVKVGKMGQGGRIINVGTNVSKNPDAFVAMYTASKAATDALTVSWASEVSSSLVMPQNLSGYIRSS